MNCKKECSFKEMNREKGKVEIKREGNNLKENCKFAFECKCLQE
jgi:hypothetical protein